MRRQLGRATCSCWYYWNEEEHLLHYSWTRNLRACSVRNLLFSQKNKVTKVFLLVFGFNLHVKLARDIFLQGMIVMTDECIWRDKMVSVTDEGGKAIGI